MAETFDLSRTQFECEDIVDILKHPKFKQFLSIMKRKGVLSTDDPPEFFLQAVNAHGKFFHGKPNSNPMLIQLLSEWKKLNVQTKGEIGKEKIGNNIKAIIQYAVSRIRYELDVRAELERILTRLEDPGTTPEDAIREMEGLPGCIAILFPNLKLGSMTP